MPVHNRHQHVLSPRYGGSARNSTDSQDGLKEQLWIVDEDYEKPHKEMDFPTARLEVKSFRQKSRNNLRINTYSKQELQDRYLSSEEEPSPSPDDVCQKYEDELTKQEPVDIFFDDDLDPAFEEIKAGIAVAVPIFAYGRPKLIDIINLAPIQKRKRPARQLYPHLPVETHVTTRTATSSAFPSTAANENHPRAAHEPAARIITPTPTPIPAPAPSIRQLKRKESFAIPAPESWLPEESAAEEDVEEDRGEQKGKEENQRVPTLPRHSKKRGHNRSVNDVAFAPNPPRQSNNRSQNHFSTRVIETDNFNYTTITPPRAPTPTITPMTIGSTSIVGWKGLTRSLSLVRRQSGSQQAVSQPQASNKKPKMIPRGANEREQMVVIPPFPFEDRIAVQVLS